MATSKVGIPQHTGGRNVCYVGICKYEEVRMSILPSENWRKMTLKTTFYVAEKGCLCAFCACSY